MQNTRTEEVTPLLHTMYSTILRNLESSILEKPKIKGKAVEDLRLYTPLKYTILTILPLLKSAPPMVDITPHLTQFNIVNGSLERIVNILNSLEEDGIVCEHRGFPHEGLKQACLSSMKELFEAVYEIEVLWGTSDSKNLDTHSHEFIKELEKKW